MKDNIDSCDTWNPLEYGFGCDPDAAITTWIGQVRAGAEWDHKSILREQLPVENRGKLCCYNKIPGMDADAYYDVWSNVHYGYVGAATGLDQDFLQFGASPGLDIPGMKSLPLVGASDPGDEATVRMGVDLWNKYGADLTQDQFHSELMKMFQELQGTDKVVGITQPPLGVHVPGGTIIP
nr:polymorphic toxin type 44 domain-containing protein [Streptomyces sp. NBC_00886]